MDVINGGALLVALAALGGSWFTWHSNRKATEGDLTLRGLKQLNDSCMERCTRLEEREKELVARIELLEGELNMKDRLIGVLRGGGA